MILKAKQFIQEVIIELKKVSWTSRQELIDSTWIVLLTTALLGVLIGLMDFALSKLLRLLIR